MTPSLLEEIKAKFKVLSCGAHQKPNGMCAACFMEARNEGLGRPWGDKSDDDCVFAQAVARVTNDMFGDDVIARGEALWEFVFHPGMLKQSPEVTEKRRWIATDRAIRIFTPLALRSAALTIPFHSDELLRHAVILETLPPTTKDTAARAARAAVAAAEAAEAAEAARAAVAAVAAAEAARAAVAAAEAAVAAARAARAAARAAVAAEAARAAVAAAEAAEAARAAVAAAEAARAAARAARAAARAAARVVDHKKIVIAKSVEMLRDIIECVA